MQFQLGDLKKLEVNLGNIALNQGSVFSSMITIHEDILDPFGPKANIQVIDYDDYIHKANFTGSYEQDILIKLTEFNRNTNSLYNFKTYQVSNLSDTNPDNSGNGRSKQYVVRCVSSELLDAQVNRVYKSYNDYTTNITKDILENNCKTNKNILIEESSSAKRRLVFNYESVSNSFNRLNQEHIGTESKSSAFVTFQKQKYRKTNYVISTFEKLFQQSPVRTLYRSGRINFSSATAEETLNSIISMNVDSSFFSLNRAFSSTSRLSFNLSTGVATEEINIRNQNFNILGRPISRNTRGNAGPTLTTIHDALNDPQNLTTAEARALRARFIAHLSENYGEFEIHGDPGISLGDVVKLNIPNLSASGNGQENIFSDDALVVSIVHKILPAGSTPRYTMVLGLVKAGVYRGGGLNP